MDPVSDDSAPSSALNDSGASGTRRPALSWSRPASNGVEPAMARSGCDVGDRFHTLLQESGPADTTRASPRANRTTRTPSPCSSGGQMTRPVSTSQTRTLPSALAVAISRSSELKSTEVTGPRWNSGVDTARASVVSNTCATLFSYATPSRLPLGENASDRRDRGTGPGASGRECGTIWPFEVP